MGSDVVELSGPDVMKLHHRALEDNREVATQRVHIRLQKIGNGLNAASVALCSNASTDTPDLVDCRGPKDVINLGRRDRAEAEDLFVSRGVAARLSFCRLGNMIGELGERLGRPESGTRWNAGLCKDPSTQGPANSDEVAERAC